MFGAGFVLEQIRLWMVNLADFVPARCACVEVERLLRTDLTGRDTVIEPFTNRRHLGYHLCQGLIITGELNPHQPGSQSMMSRYLRDCYTVRHRFTDNPLVHCIAAHCGVIQIEDSVAAVLHPKPQCHGGDNQNYDHTNDSGVHRFSIPASRLLLTRPGPYLRRVELWEKAYIIILLNMHQTLMLGWYKY